MQFKLTPQLAEKKDVIELSNSIIKFVDDQKQCPWILIIPKIINNGNFTDLNKEQQKKLMEEVSTASNIMTKIFSPDRINIAIIGNKTPQIHVHIICRYKSDPYWPETIWDKKKDPMDEKESAIKITKIKTEFEKIN